MGFASEDGATPGTDRGTLEVPPLEEINADPQFDGKAIDRATFEALWVAYVSGRPAEG